MTRRRRHLLALGLAGLIPLMTVTGSARADVPGIVLSLTGPTPMTEPSATYGGQLSLAGIVPLGRDVSVILNLDGRGHALTQMRSDGTYSFDVSFPFPGDFELQAVADRGEPLETHSNTLIVRAGEFGDTYFSVGAGNAFGGSPGTGACPAASVLVGVRTQRTHETASLRGVEGICREVSIEGGSYELEGPVVTTTRVGSLGSIVADSACSDGDVVVGFDGRHGGLVDGLRAVCQTLLDDGGLSGTDSLATYAGGTEGEPFPIRRCDPADAALGVDGRGGQSLDYLRLSCGPVT